MGPRFVPAGLTQRETHCSCWSCILLLATHLFLSYMRPILKLLILPGSRSLGSYRGSFLFGFWSSLSYTTCFFFRSYKTKTFVLFLFYLARAFPSLDLTWRGPFLLPILLDSFYSKSYLTRTIYLFRFYVTRTFCFPSLTLREFFYSNFTVRESFCFSTFTCQGSLL